jgi:phage gpG-like protein
MVTRPPEEIATLIRDDLIPDAERVVTAFLKQARVMMIADVKENFARSSDPDGRPWAPLRFPRPRGGSKPLLDTGQLRASITGASPEFREEEGPNYVTIGTTRPGANLMQQGGTVLPRKGKALAIPLTKDAVRSGGPRRFSRPLFLLWRRGANSGVLAEKTQGGRKKKAGLIAHFALVRKVVVPARPFIGFGRRLIDKLDALARRTVREMFRRGARRTGGE